MVARPAMSTKLAGEHTGALLLRAARQHVHDDGAVNLSTHSGAKMKLRDLLDQKGRAVVDVGVDATIQAAASAMVQARVGSVLVLGPGGEIVGILTERDVLRATASRGAAAADTPVHEAMTRAVLVLLPDDSVDTAMALMTERRLRHVPVIEGGQVIGVVSIGDAVRATRAAVEAEVRALEDYVTGRYPA